MLLEHSQLSTTEIYGQFRPKHLGKSDDQHPGVFADWEEAN